MSLEISYATEGIKSLREEYKYFDQYLEGKDINDYEQLLWAYKFEINNYSRDVSFDLSLDDELFDKEASKVLFLIRDIINLSKVAQTEVFLGSLINITGASNWKDLKAYFDSFNSYVNSIDKNLCIASLDEIIEVLVHDHELGSKQKSIFIMFLVLKAVRYVCQNRQSPPYI